MKHLLLVLLVLVAGILGIAVASIALEVPSATAQSTGPYLELNPTTISVPKGSTFGVDITVSATGSLPIQGAQLFLDFDPTFLRVLSNGRSTGPVIPGSSFGDPSQYVSQSSVDDSTGRVEFLIVASATGSAVTAPFVLGSIQFQGVAVTPLEGTSISFHTRSPRQTRLLLSGFQENSTSQGVTVRIRELIDEGAVDDQPEQAQSSDDSSASNIESESTVSRVNPTPLPELPEVVNNPEVNPTGFKSGSSNVLPATPADTTQPVPDTQEKVEAQASDSETVGAQPSAPKNSNAPVPVQPEESAAVESLDEDDTSVEPSETQPNSTVGEKVVESTNSDFPLFWLYLGLGLAGAVSISIMGVSLWRNKYRGSGRWNSSGMDNAYEDLFQHFKSLTP